MKKIQILILSVMLMVTGVTAQSDDLMSPGLTPDSPFYFVEQAVEKIEVSTARIVGGPDFVSKVQANNAEERLSEARELISRNKTEKADRLMAEYSRTLNQSIDNARNSNNTELNERLVNMSDNHVEALKKVEKQVPAEARKGINTALKNSQKSREKLGKPIENIPGDQQKGRGNPKKGKTGKGLTKGNEAKPELKNSRNEKETENGKVPDLNSSGLGSKSKEKTSNLSENSRKPETGKETSNLVNDSTETELNRDQGNLNEKPSNSNDVNPRDSDPGDLQNQESKEPGLPQ